MKREFQIDDTELIALIERFKVFLKKLEDRALELEAETVEAAQEISDYDEIRYHHFKVGIKGQYNELNKKAKQIFKEQIKKQSLRQYADYDEIRFNDSVIAYECKINHTEELLEKFEERIDAILKNIFDKVKVLSPKEKLKQILADYEVTKESFCCQQCGAKLKLEQVYFVSAYITCEYCQTQNTFTPSMRLSLLPDLVREIARDSVGELEYPVNGKNTFEQLKRVENHSRKEYFIKQKLIPQLTDSYQDIYKREINDFLISHDLDDDNYNQIINQYNNDSIKPLINNYTQNSQHNNREENLNQLNIIINNIVLNIKLLSVSKIKDSNLKSSFIDDLENSKKEIQNLIHSI
jgi:hypothetical protein